jgi:hypothetical protein
LLPNRQNFSKRNFKSKGFQFIWIHRLNRSMEQIFNRKC